MPFPTVILSGYLAEAADYQTMQQTLTEMGLPTLVVPLVKWDWLPTLGGRSVLPILEALHRTVQQAMQKFETDRVNLVGHSAGGWIARIYLGETPYDIHRQQPERICTWNAHNFVAQLVTLGTPHTSFERWTLKNLNFVNITYPGAFYPQVQYHCIAGKAIYGRRRWGSWLAHSSYQLTCGEGETWGDGITPIVAAHLEGANNLTLEQVYHSSRSPGSWYGTPAIVHQWGKYLA